jgi:hypothetical protein
MWPGGNALSVFRECKQHVNKITADCTALVWYIWLQNTHQDVWVSLSHLRHQLCVTQIPKYDILLRTRTTFSDLLLLRVQCFVALTT